MANRPIFIPKTEGSEPGVIIKNIDFKWFPGMAKVQKQKSIVSLHETAKEQNISPILEISSKSELDLGVNLSAFNLMVTTKKLNKSFSVETAFQSSKVFENGGPYADLLEKTSREAKKDIRLKESGNLLKFKFYNEEFSIKPRTFFYDWIYINALNQNNQFHEEILTFNGFSDIEFNPQKSINCQAYSSALFVSLVKMNKLMDALKSPDDFKRITSQEYLVKDEGINVQRSLI